MRAVDGKETASTTLTEMNVILVFTLSDIASSNKDSSTSCSSDTIEAIRVAISAVDALIRTIW